MERSFRLGKRFYLIMIALAVLLVGIVVGVVIVLQEMTGHIRRMSVKSLYSEIETRAVIIREEQSFSESASDAKIISFSGSYVQEGDDIVVLYPYGYESALSTICSKEADLYAKLEMQLRTLNGGVLPPDVQSMTDDINSLGNRMRLASNGESFDSYTEMEEQLISLLKERRDLMVSMLSDASTLASEIKDLELQYKSFETNMAHTVQSSFNGYVSFYTDSNEEPLKDVNQLTVSQVRRVMAATSFASDSENFSYRIVTNRSVFYVAFVASTTTEADLSKRLMPGQTYPFKIKGIEDVFNGTVVSEKDASNGILYVLSVSADVRPLLDARVVDITIQNTATGPCIPTDYIEYSNGVPYVSIKSDYGYTPIAVYIAGSDGEEAVIAARDENLKLFSGLRYRMPVRQDD